MSNIVSGNQMRCARILADLTQAELASAAGLHVRSIRYHESKGGALPTCVESTLDDIERAFEQYGIILFAKPTPGVRLEKLKRRNCR
jgi:DNA-binding XRE family transcriptional regulator